MNNQNDICQLNEPKGSFISILFGFVFIVIAVVLIDYLWIDLISGIWSLEWIRNVFGILSGNIESEQNISWIYLIVICTSFLVGMISVKWYKGILSALLIPILYGITYSLIGISFGEGVDITEIIIAPLFFSLPYIIPSAISSVILTLILSNHSPVRKENFISGIR